MKIVITGGTGFIGTALTKRLLKFNHEIIILCRTLPKTNIMENVKYIQWLNDGDTPEKELADTDCIINLAGATISKPWTDSYKELIVNSRLETTKEVLRIIEQLEVKPSILINASAIGYYGTSDVRYFTESSLYPGEDFLATTCKQWEDLASNAYDLGVKRVVYTRFGLILDNRYGALPRMVTPYRMMVGGNLGTGEQWYSWIHIDDVIGSIIHILRTPKLKGPVNIVSPMPVRMKDFGKELAKVLGKPHYFTAPSFVLKSLLGEMSMLVLQGQHVMPEKLIKTNYDFKYPYLSTALRSLYRE